MLCFQILYSLYCWLYSLYCWLYSLYWHYIPFIVTQKCLQPIYIPMARFPTPNRAIWKSFLPLFWPKTEKLSGFFSLICTRKCSPHTWTLESLYSSLSFTVLVSCIRCIAGCIRCIAGCIRCIALYCWLYLLYCSLHWATKSQIVKEICRIRYMKM